MLYVCLVSLDVNNFSRYDGAKLLRHLYTITHLLKACLCWSDNQLKLLYIVHCNGMICTHNNAITHYDITMDVPNNIITHCDVIMSDRT